ncbi:nitrile hydratase accessory protein [Rhodococcus pyridinivorans]|uniref:nitrile hydratase accessory protein n=1 Tax=Rhodococcus pyridinivorans TaxID=103816 RepID=UPI0020788850|nr:nitrile hydratase accessory protein [Rhodococcus pyridinivorans]USI93099.1 nitrile hydratase accessory protein [Rhodococcus pyridinivorans]
MSIPQTSVSRQAVEELLCDLPASRTGDRSFDEPWEIRAFAIAVSAHKAGQYEWKQFQSALIESIGKWENSVSDLQDSSWSYYENWLTALEEVLSDVGLIDPDSLSIRTNEILAIPPNRNHHKAILDPVSIDPAPACDS